jgi:ABC-2 type transport system permease protein
VTVFRRFLKDRRRGLIGWTLGIFAFIFLQNAFYPSFKNQPELSQYFDQISEGAGAFFGISESIPIITPPGWLQAQVFAFVPVLLSIYAISQGVRAIATSEQEGTLELLVANPIERQRLAWERYWGVVALVFVVGAIACAATLATTPLLQLIEGVSIPGYVAATFGTIVLSLLFGSLAFGVGAATGRRSLALSIAAIVTIATYMINGLAGSVDAAHPLRFVSPFHWFLGRNMLAQGIAWEALTLPVIFSALFAVWGVWGFSRRDLH